MNTNKQHRADSLTETEEMEYKFTKDNFEAEVVKSDKPVLVDFYADWCGPCRSMMPAVEALAEKYEGAARRWAR